MRSSTSPGTSSPAMPGLLGRALGRLEGRDLIIALRATALLEAIHDAQLDAARAQPVGERKGEELRHADALRLVRGEEAPDDRRRRVADGVHRRPELAGAVRIHVL